MFVLYLSPNVSYNFLNDICTFCLFVKDMYPTCGVIPKSLTYITKSKIILFTFLQKMSDDDKDEYEEAMRNPYRDDPVWEDWHSQAYGVQGGLDDTSSSESEDETINMQPVTLPSSCVCQHCRLVLTL